MTAEDFARDTLTPLRTARRYLRAWRLAGVEGVALRSRKGSQGRGRGQVYELAGDLPARWRRGRLPPVGR